MTVSEIENNKEKASKRVLRNEFIKEGKSEFVKEGKSEFIKEGKRRMTIDVDEKLMRTMKAYCAMKRVHLNEGICNAVVEYLDKRGFQVSIAE